MGPSETENPTVGFDVPEHAKAQASHHHMIDFPKGSTLWTGSNGWTGAWYVDNTGLKQGTAEDGVWFTRRTEDEKAARMNESRLTMHLYTPTSGNLKFTGVSVTATREHIKIVANVSAPMSPIGLEPHVSLRRAPDSGWTPLALRDTPADIDLDTYVGVRTLGFQPLLHLPDFDHPPHSSAQC
jgi:hypothetical protein